MDNQTVEQDPAIEECCRYLVSSSHSSAVWKSMIKSPTTRDTVMYIMYKAALKAFKQSGELRVYKEGENVKVWFRNDFLLEFKFHARNSENSHVVGLAVELHFERCHSFGFFNGSNSIQRQALGFRRLASSQQDWSNLYGRSHARSQTYSGSWWDENPRASL